jgi:hypothetical protein
MSVIPWNKSEARSLLKRDIINGRVTKSTDIDSLWESSVLYQQYSKNNFKANFRSLLASIEKYQERAERDNAALEHDRRLHPRGTTTSNGEPFWDGSLAQSLLKRDVANGLHQEMQPRDLWTSRDAYQSFALETFKKHMYKEKTSANEKSYWLNKKKK